MKRLASFAAMLLLATMIPAPSPAQAGLPAPASSFSVTLITGDRVLVSEGASPSVDIVPGRGRHVTFHTTYGPGGVRVVPSDVAPLIGNKLDPQLFDVTALRRVSRGGRTPLIVQGGVALPGHPLASIRARAVSTSDAFALDSVEHVWLDGLVRADAVSGKLDRNLRQIEAPAAWDSGLSGSGVRVAVLDTGVDASHPDLAGRVATAENFTDSPDAVDRNGHGTHVASLIAGSGAAADGARRGVAFNSTLLSAKVLGDDGVGQFSDIIAGMEWAVAQGSRVINMSLSSEAPSDGSDPVSQAVQTLTASSGTLFVTSAGNRGPGESTIGAPGVAEAALTVGAVDQRDRLADFSSRGPRTGDSLVKPEIVAPGVDIVAARAAGTDLGDPVSPRYTRLSGTSMAAPHVAGAAALLAELHPRWTASYLKAALVGSAAPVAGGVFEAGAGRIDLARGVSQKVLAITPILSFGFASYPQAGVHQREVTLANTGATPVTVELSAQMRGLSVSPSSVRIPAGGEGTVTATVDVTAGGFGNLSGAVTSRPLRIPAGLVKEPIHHIVHINALDRLGTGNIETLAWMVNLGDVTRSPRDPVLLLDGAGTARVRPGFYAITAAIPTLEEGEPPPDTVAAVVVTSVSIATIAEVSVQAETWVTLDARRAQPVSASIAGAETTPIDLHVFVAAKDRAGNGSVLAYATSAQDVVEHKLFIEPTASARNGQLELSSKWRLETTGGGPTYDLLFAGDRFPQSLEYTVDPASLATIRTTYRTPGTPVDYIEGRFVHTKVNPVSIAVLQPTPLFKVEHLSPGKDMNWFQCANLILAEHGGVGGYCQRPATYHSGENSDRAWLRAPLRTRAGASFATRSLLIGLDELADDEGNVGSIAGFVLSNRSYALYRNGSLIAEGVDPLGAHPIPRGNATFQLTRKFEAPLGRSTAVESSWTFRTGAQIIDVAVHVPVDADNRSPGVLPLTVEVSRRVSEVSLQLSTDDGRTWQTVTLRRAGSDLYRATVDLPLGPVSLRTAASDGQGNHSEQTVLRAIEIRG